MSQFEWHCKDAFEQYGDMVLDDSVLDEINTLRSELLRVVLLIEDGQSIDPDELYELLLLVGALEFWD